MKGFSQFLFQPQEPFRIASVDMRRRFHFECDNLAMAFEYQVDLVAVAASEVEHLGSVFDGLKVGAQFGGNERFKKLADQGRIAFEHCCIDVE